MTEIENKLDEIQMDIENNPVILFMKGDKDAPMCRFSLDVVRTLNSLGIDFETRNVLEDDVLREAIKIFSDWPTIPQLYVRGEFIGGRDIVLELNESGELKEILA